MLAVLSARIRVLCCRQSILNHHNFLKLKSGVATERPEQVSPSRQGVLVQFDYFSPSGKCGHLFLQNNSPAPVYKFDT